MTPVSSMIDKALPFTLLQVTVLRCCLQHFISPITTLLMGPSSFCHVICANQPMPKSTHTYTLYQVTMTSAGLKYDHGYRNANENKVSVMTNQTKGKKKIYYLSISVQASQNSKPGWNTVIYCPILNGPCIRFNQISNINTGQ